MIRLQPILIIIFGFLIALSCDSKSGNSDNPIDQDQYDRGKLLTHLANQYIIPSIADFSQELADLKTAGQNFQTTTDVASLSNLRTAWSEAYHSWQSVEMFNIGKAEEIGWNYFMNIYPTNVEDIHKNIEQAQYDLDHPNNHDAQGFPALDYLLYGIGQNDDEVVAAYQEASIGQQRIQYLMDIIDQMIDKTGIVHADWENRYKELFIQSTGNSSTSALNLLVNDFIFYFEKGLRANKFGIPAGVFSSSPLPDRVEAYYKGDLAKELALAGLQSAMNFYLGHRSHGNTGEESLFDYVHYLTTQTKTKVGLEQLILDQMQAAYQQIETLPNDFTAQIQEDNTEMTRAYDALQKVVVSLKVDMLQTLNISVDYVDADGD